MKIRTLPFVCCVALTLPLGCTTTRTSAPAPVPAGAGSLDDKQHELIRVVQSQAPAGDKAIACKKLAVYGTEEAVPALAPLLADVALASWARIALEAIPGPAADDALRKAMGRLRGKLLIGVVNSLGVRRDPKSVIGLAKKLSDKDDEVASAAAVALGRIGGEEAAQLLERALAGTRAAVRPAVAEGCVLCAERYLNEGYFAGAVQLYDTVRRADVPKQLLLEAARGAILARQTAGLPMLLEQLRSADADYRGIGLRTARELAGRQVTEALAAELARASAERQVYLLLALADRSDEVVFPAVLKAARKGSKKLRLAAIGVLDRLGRMEGLPVLLDAAAYEEADLGNAALSALARLPGSGVDADLLARLPQSTGEMRRVLIELSGQRRIEAAISTLLLCAEEPAPGIRSAAVQALGVLGNDKQTADLVRLLLKAQSSKDREDLETALIAIVGRSGTNCVPHLLPLAQSEDAALRTIALHALAGAGGPAALEAVKAAVEDKDESVQDEAARTLSTWPNNWPEDSAVAEPLLALAKTGKKTSHQMLALRGYLQYLKGDKQLKDDEKVAKVKELLPLVQRPEEKRLVIAALEPIPTAAVLEMMIGFTGETDLVEDASSALLQLADKGKDGLTNALRQKALQTVVAKTKNEETKKKAEKILKGIQ